LGERAILLSRRQFGLGAAALPFLPAPGRPVVVASDEDVTTLDPHLIRNNHPIGSIIWSIFDSLVRRRPDGTHEPRLALGWEQPTANCWRFHLRPGVHFQNGEAFDAQAVVASIQRMNISPFNGESQLWQQTNLRHVAALDPLTVELTTDGPAVTMLYWLEEAFIAPPRYLAETPAAVIGAHPIGSGPYSFVEWQQGDHVTLTANDAHWAGPPPIRDVIFRAVPEQSSRLNELRAGSVDLVPGLDPDNAGSAASALSRAVPVPGLRKMHMGFSQSGIAALKDRRVRQAINYAVDVATMIDTLERRMAAPLTSVVNPPNNDPSLHPFAYDPARAAALLRDAGHEGFAVEIAFDSKYADALESCEVVAAYLGAIGLLANVVAYESGHFAETLRARAFPGLYFYGFGALIQPLVELVIFTSGAVDNASGYHNPEVDRLVKNAAVTPDETDRNTLLRQAEKLVWEDCPWLYLWHLPEINGLSNRLLFTPRADEYVELYQARLAAS
jgi:peptide/nickel transport system substrate-binding protein